MQSPSEDPLAELSRTALVPMSMGPRGWSPDILRNISKDAVLLSDIKILSFSFRVYNT